MEQEQTSGEMFALFFSRAARVDPVQRHHLATIRERTSRVHLDIGINRHSPRSEI